MGLPPLSVFFLLCTQLAHGCGINLKKLVEDGYVYFVKSVALGGIGEGEVWGEGGGEGCRLWNERRDLRVNDYVMRSKEGGGRPEGRREEEEAKVKGCGVRSRESGRDLEVPSKYHLSTI